MYPCIIGWIFQLCPENLLIKRHGEYLRENLISVCVVLTANVPEVNHLSTVTSVAILNLSQCLVITSVPTTTSTVNTTYRPVTQLLYIACTRCVSGLSGYMLILSHDHHMHQIISIRIVTRIRKLLAWFTTNESCLYKEKPWCFG